MGITIKEIAEKANVSIGTVDRVLHNRGRFSEETASRIRQICEEYGYTSNVIGKAMAMQRSKNVIAVVINSKERNAFSARVHDGIEDYSKTVLDYNVSFCFYDTFANTPEEMSTILDDVLSQNISGLIIKPLDDISVREKLMTIAEERQIPIVTCTSDLVDITKIAYVGQDHLKLGRMLACTASKLLPKKMKVLVVVGPLISVARRDKLSGFRSYLDDKGTDYEILDICEVPFDEEIAYKRIKECLAQHPEANALYLHAPDLAPCMRALEEQEFGGLKFTYSHTISASELIKTGKLDFAVYENPYRQGFSAGEVMMTYLLTGNCPPDRRFIVDGQIVFDENC